MNQLIGIEEWGLFKGVGLDSKAEALCKIRMRGGKALVGRRDIECMEEARSLWGEGNQYLDSDVGGNMLLLRVGGRKYG